MLQGSGVVHRLFPPQHVVRALLGPFVMTLRPLHEEFASDLHIIFVSLPPMIAVSAGGLTEVVMKALADIKYELTCHGR